MSRVLINSSLVFSHFQAFPKRRYAKVLIDTDCYIGNKLIKLKPHFLYSKTGVCRGIHTFPIFAPKHRLWVLVRTAKRFLRVLRILCFELK